MRQNKVVSLSLPEDVVRHLQRLAAQQQLDGNQINYLDLIRQALADRYGITNPSPARRIIEPATETR